MKHTTKDGNSCAETHFSHCFSRGEPLFRCKYRHKSENMQIKLDIFLKLSEFIACLATFVGIFDVFVMTYSVCTRLYTVVCTILCHLLFLSLARTYIIYAAIARSEGRQRGSGRQQAMPGNSGEVRAAACISA